jgi:hypothetical protein
MKNLLLLKTAFFTIILFSTSSLVSAWGVWGHQHINRAAVFALPQEMKVFFYNHIDFITEEATIPDVRKYTINDKEEAARHFLDVEAYGEKPFETLARTWKEAQATYDQKDLKEYGILPWYIQEIQTKLTQAFKDRNKSVILFLAADLGHYLGDAHMPLHTSLNYDGQLSEQKGIHAFWESQLPELFGETYNFKVKQATYIADPVAESLRLIQQTHSLVDTLLNIEKKLQNELPKEKIYAMDSSGNILRNKYKAPFHSYEYARLYHKQLNGMVEKQIRASVEATANFWYTAWVDAGKPDITQLDSQALTRRNKKHLKQEMKLWNRGKLFDIKINPEF